ncbi:MAG: hypothetical protein KC620_14905 [Myxococcales bacterium]|nr:hypothetical protein [Myxococcales bacterium]
MRSAVLLTIIAVTGCGGNAAGLGMQCYAGAWGGKSGPIPCSSKKGFCEPFYNRCVIPVQKGARCDSWPWPPGGSGHHQCRVLVEQSGAAVDAGVCQQGKCKRAQRKGARCTPYDGKGPYCRFGVKCEDGRCASD